MEKIDFVLPWVDSSDKAWQEQRQRYGMQVNKLDANSDARFRDLETLKYVLRSIEKNCPWYNKIYLITVGHYPAWLNINHPKIQLITHQELFFDVKNLPVFNSVAIEMNLANIEELSEKFIYTNDDLIIINPIAKNRFFQDNLPVDFIEHGIISRKIFFKLLNRIDTWISSLNNCFDLINLNIKPKDIDKKYFYDQSYSFIGRFNNFLARNIFRKYFWLKHWHHPQPYLKSNIHEVFLKFKNEMLRSSAHKFRDYGDLSPYLYRYWHLSNGNFYPKKYNDDLVDNIDTVNELQQMLEIIKKNNGINFVCFNDSAKLSENEFIVVKKQLLEFLHKNFPHKASFEI